MGTSSYCGTHRKSGNNGWSYLLVFRYSAGQWVVRRSSCVRQKILSCGRSSYRLPPWSSRQPVTSQTIQRPVDTVFYRDESWCPLNMARVFEYLGTLRISKDPNGWFSLLRFWSSLDTRRFFRTQNCSAPFDRFEHNVAILTMMMMNMFRLLALLSVTVSMASGQVRWYISSHKHEKNEPRV